MKLKHPTHDPKPMDALSYYLQVASLKPIPDSRSITFAVYNFLL